MSDMYLMLEGVDGESRGTGHEDEIDVESWSWGMIQPGSMATGGGGGVGKVQVQDLNISKGVDKATPTLMLKCCKGEHIPTAKLTVRKAGGDQQEYIVISMEKVFVTNINTAGADEMSEELTLQFEKVQYDYFPQKEDGSLDAAVSLVWDIPGGTDA